MSEAQVERLFDEDRKGGDPQGGGAGGGGVGRGRGRSRGVAVKQLAQELKIDDSSLELLMKYCAAPVIHTNRNGSIGTWEPIRRFVDDEETAQGAS